MIKVLPRYVGQMKTYAIFADAIKNEYESNDPQPSQVHQAIFENIIFDLVRSVLPSFHLDKLTGEDAMEQDEFLVDNVKGDNYNDMIIPGVMR